MRASVLLIGILFFASAGKAKPLSLWFLSKNEGYCSLIDNKKNTYCITQSALYKVEKSGLRDLLSFSFTCHEATLYKDTILLATGNGIKKFIPAANIIVDFLPASVKGDITHIQSDETDAVWFTKEFEGCFKISNGSAVQQIVKVPVTYSMVHTPDSLMWVGTNVGLYKVPVSGEEIDRYAEEGIADNDLPDNLVERLFAGASKGVWAIMPGHVSYIVPGQDEEGPDLENIGRRGNELFSITEMPALPQCFLFVGSEGILYMPQQNDAGQFRIGEIHQTIHESAYLLTDNILQKPEAFTGNIVKKIQILKNKICFITDKGFWMISTEKFTRDIKNHYGKLS